ncbi:hypothetical protein ES703_118938 [subsurface metagenome]
MQDHHNVVVRIRPDIEQRGENMPSPHRYPIIKHNPPLRRTYWPRSFREELIVEKVLIYYCIRPATLDHHFLLFYKFRKIDVLIKCYEFFPSPYKFLRPFFRKGMVGTPYAFDIFLKSTFHVANCAGFIYMCILYNKLFCWNLLPSNRQ